MPQEALRRCGIRYTTRVGRYVPPSPKTIKRAVRAVGAQAADEQLRAWLRGTVRPDGTRPHMLSAFDVAAGTVLGQADVNGKTNLCQFFGMSWFMPRAGLCRVRDGGL